MQFTVLTLFPEIVNAYFASSIMAKALDRGIIRYRAVNIRDFAAGKHKTCDDAPYGGGPGMLILAEPLKAALESVGVGRHSGEATAADGGVGADLGCAEGGPGEAGGTAVPPGNCPEGPQGNRPPSIKKRPHVVYLSPSGRPFTQGRARELAGMDELVLICGRYEGLDQRVIDGWVDEELSVGDYVLSSGEVAALAVIDVVYRLVEGVISPASLEEESFSGGLLEYPQYTRPEVYDTLKVPEVLLSGHHERIRRWRLEERVRKTLRQRPDLIRRGRELGLFDGETNSIIDRQIAEGDEQNERD